MVSVLVLFLVPCFALSYLICFYIKISRGKPLLYTKPYCLRVIEQMNLY
nr:MAG TPA: hypothetical protein [Caudoviricetes sp.]